MDGVVNVWQSRTVRRPQVTKLEETTYISSNARLNYSVHQWTGVDRLHSRGVRGKGATVAIIDTGIDYTHKTVS